MDAIRQLYGLGVATNVPLGALSSLPEVDRLDVRIELGDEALRFASDPVRDIYISAERGEHGRPTVHAGRLDSGGVRIAYSDGTVVVIDPAAQRICAYTPPGQTPDDTAAYLLGPVMGALLRMRGVVCLHASAVEVNGHAVALVGPAGAGKSSSAAAFACAGYAVVTDDLLAIDDAGGMFTVRAGYPRLRLWGDSAAALFGRADALPKISPGWDKHYLDLSSPRFNFDAQPRPLGAVYVLAHEATAGGLPEIREMESTQPLLELVANSFATYYQDAQARGAELAFLAALCERVPVRRLVMPRDFAALAALPGVITARFP